MKYENLPIFKVAIELCAYIETIVRGFEKYHKYTIGSDLRSESRAALYLIHRANLSINNYKFKRLDIKTLKAR